MVQALYISRKYNLLAFAIKYENDDIFDLILEHTPRSSERYPGYDNSLFVVCYSNLAENKKIERYDKLLKKGWSFDKEVNVDGVSVVEMLVKYNIDCSFIFRHNIRWMNVNEKNILTAVTRIAQFLLRSWNLKIKKQ